MKKPLSNNEEKKTTSEKPISFAGIDFKRLLSAFLKVKPDEEETKEKGKEIQKPSSE